MALLSTLRNTAAAALIVIGSVQSFSLPAKNNVAVYWGQRTDRLAHLCENDAVDVVLLNFMNNFPGQDESGLPGTNFAGNCSTAPFPGSHLLKPCAPMPEDIRTCQNVGKKVILALGGGSGYQLSGAAAGEELADSLWVSLVLYSQAGYIAMINRLRSYFDKEEKQYFITDAPQCVVPDPNMGEMMTKAQFDMLLVQFYSTPECSARRSVDSREGFTYDALTSFLEGTPSENAKIYLGLPAATSAANSLQYLHPTEVEKLVQAHAEKPNFGGIMLWDAMRAEENMVGGKPYHEVAKGILNRFAGGATENIDNKTAPKKHPKFISASTLVTKPATFAEQFSPNSAVEAQQKTKAKNESASNNALAAAVVALAALMAGIVYFGWAN